MQIALPVLIAYLLGAVPFALLVCKIAGVGDIRQIGSGNIGATNVWRAAGFRVAVWVFIGDIGKGALAVIIARFYVDAAGAMPIAADVLLVACALAAVIGHVFPIYLRFKGGKGVNTALGAFLILLPVESLIAFGVFLLVVLMFRYVSLGSICGAVAFFAAIMAERHIFDKPVDVIYVYLSAVLVVLIVITHRGNLARLLAGKESRFSFSSREGKHDDRS